VVVTYFKRDVGPGPKPARDFDGIYRAHAARVARWAGRLGGPLIDVEDAVQEVFLTVHRLLPGFRGEAQVTTWLYRITANVVRHRRRKERFRRWLGGSSSEVAAHVESLRPTPVEELERRQSTELVYRVLDRLSERARTLVILFELEELSGEEIAELMGLSLSNVWVSLHRARAQFLDQLRKLERAAGRRRGGA
jgi:RNA polymerase sigma-70 factor (ECF subfamily)